MTITSFQMTLYLSFYQCIHIQAGSYASQQVHFSLQLNRVFVSGILSLGKEYRRNWMWGI